MASPPLSPEERAELDRLDRLVGLGRDREARSGLRVLSDAHPSHGIVTFLYAKALRRLGEHARAGEVLARAEQLAPGDPHVGLGLAWVAMDAGDLERAVALSRPAREVRSLRGDALAIAAREREIAPDPEAARALFLESYEATPRLDVLAACERLSGIARDDDADPAPWPISVLQRRWLFRAIETELAARARARFGDLPAQKLLTAGCDHGASLTVRWAERAGVERVSLLRALADRGGFCDCEVCLNASRGDDEDVSVLLVAGRTEGGIPEGDPLESFFVREDVAPPTLSESLERDRDESARDDAFAVYRDASGVGISPQLVTDSLLADLVDTLARTREASLSVTLVVLAPDLVDPTLRPAIELATVSTSGLTTMSLTETPSARVRAALPWVEPTLAALERALPKRTLEPTSGRWELGAIDRARPKLLARGETSLVLDLEGLERWPVPASLVLSPDGNHAVWLRARRTRSELVLEERARGERRVIATDRFRGAPWLEADGTRVIASAGGQILAFDTRTRERRVIARGDELAISPDGHLLAIARERTASIVVLDRDGRTVFGPFSGRAPLFSPRGDRLVYLARERDRSEGTSFQARVLELGDGAHRRAGPAYEEACWPSFALDGRALVFQARVERRWIPLDDGRSRLEEKERLFLVDLDAGDAVRELYATNDGSLRIVGPLAHPHLPLVALRTKDAPRLGERLVSVGTDGLAKESVVASEPLTPSRWLG
jgi:hypothetical protein